jgi:pyruvate dehydrogenase E1 component alpha subunit
VEPTAADLTQMYRRMLLIRGFDERALELRRQELIGGSVHPYIGQEGVAVGICSALDERDRVISTHRGHGHCIAVGVDVDAMMAELLGRASGVCKGKGGSMHIADFSVGMLGANGIVGAGVPIAAGAALSELLDGGDGVCVSFFGDGASGQGILYESLNLATLWRLPVVFVCENNRYSSDTPLDQALAVERFAGVAGGFGLPARVVDGNDVLAVRTAADRAVAHARAGGGPQVLECMTYRWGPHVQRFADLRDPAEVAAARLEDPIRRLREDLIERGVLDARTADAIARDAARELDDAVAAAKAAPYPEPHDALEDVFA